MVVREVREIDCHVDDGRERYPKVEPRLALYICLDHEDPDLARDEVASWGVGASMGREQVPDRPRRLSDRKGGWSYNTTNF